MSVQLRSPAFTDGDQVPIVYTCDGADQSPPLAWSDAPDGTVAFALMVDDPDAPGGVFTHWMLADIPGTVHALAAGRSAGVTGTNDFPRIGYGGPCPPRSHGAHRYRFQLHALNRTLGLPRGFSRAAFDATLRGAVMATATLTARYERRR